MRRCSTSLIMTEMQDDTSPNRIFCYQIGKDQKVGNRPCGKSGEQNTLGPSSRRINLYNFQEGQSVCDCKNFAAHALKPSDTDARWQGLRTQRGPARPAERVLDFVQNRNQMQPERKWEKSLLKTESADTERERESGRLRKERRESSVFAWGLGFLLRTVAWCTVFPGIQEQRRV